MTAPTRKVKPEVQYFRPRNWQKFQHYRNRRPPWIRFYTDLLTDHAFNQLTPLQQLILMKLWLLYAVIGKPLVNDTRWIGAQLGLDSRGIGKALPTLFSNDFIELCDENASNMLAPCYQHASAETETESETEADTDSPPIIPPEQFARSPPSKEAFSGNGLAADRPLPPDWSPSDTSLRYARKRLGNAPELVARIIQKMHNSSDGGTCRADWQKTFRWHVDREKAQ